MTPPPWLRRLIQAVGLVGVFAIAVLAVVYSDQVNEHLQGAGYLAVFVITVVASATIILPAPAAISVGAFAVALDNIWAVGLVAATGQQVGELTGYYLGWAGNPAVARMRGYVPVHRWMVKRGLLTLFVLAVIPNPFFDIAGMVAGATRFGVFKFVAATWPGLVLKNLGFALAGVAGFEFVTNLIG